MRMTKYNPSVQQIPRRQHAPVMPERGDSSILRWLENTGRMIPREGAEAAAREEADNEEISDLMGNDDASFDDSDNNSDDSDNDSDD